ncbi:hypothetical protein BIS12_17090, partial [Halomonas sp. 707D7]|nr:hypothetical protein [Halomonas sp. 707D7]
LTQHDTNSASLPSSIDEVLAHDFKPIQRLNVTRLPRRDWRSLFIGLVILNSLIAQFLGGMSIYTLLYRVETPSLAWLNEPSILMVLIFLLIPLTHAIGRLDFYMNDLYQVGRLERETAAVEAYS